MANQPHDHADPDSRTGLKRRTGNPDLFATTGWLYALAHKSERICLMRSIATFAAAMAGTFVTMASPVSAGDWFLHKFGELRSFHGDWLAVCNDNGDGPCRIVATTKDHGSDSVFDTRLSISFIEGPNEWAVEFMDRGMPYTQASYFRFDTGQDWMELAPGAWTPGERGYTNVTETITVVDPASSDRIVRMMMAGNWLSVTYNPVGTGDGQARFPLRGVTAAVNAVESHVRARQ